MSAADDIREFITPMLDGWRVQFGRWTDGGNAHRYAVLRPTGGLPVSLVREPQFSLSLISAGTDDITVAQAKADELIEAMRESSGDLVYLQPAEPVYVPTSDGRHVFEIAVSAITN